jgi:hypothetical protein
MLYNYQAKKRWDGLIVCPNDWEQKHPVLRMEPHFRRRQGTEGAVAARSGGVRSEPPDTSILVCDVYTSMGVVGYGTTGCAQVGSYNTAFPLTSLTPPYTGTVPIIVPNPDPLFANVIYLGYYDPLTLFADSSTTPLQQTGAGPVCTIDSSTYKYGGASLLSAGGTVVLEYVASSRFQQLNGSFTVEGWIRPDTVAGVARYIWYVWVSAGQTMVCQITAAGRIQLTAHGVTIACTTLLTASEWNYFCVTSSQISGGTSRISIYFAGPGVTTATREGTSTSVAQGTMGITNALSLMNTPALFGSAVPFPGSLDELRMTASLTGNADRYGNVTSFTVPTSQFSNY